MNPAEGRKRGELAWTIVAWVLLGAGVWLRFRRLAWMQFERDQEYFLLRAFEAQQTWGASFGLKYSTGIVMPPFLLDLLALVLLVTRDPVRIAAFVAGANLLGLAAFHVFVRRLFSARTALWTSVFLATMPWAVLRSRSVWPPDCLFPFVALFLLLLSSHVDGSSRWKTWATVAAFGVMCQVHQPAWLLVPPLLLGALLYRVRIPRTEALVALLILALLYARWLVHEIGCGFDDIAWFWHARASGGGQAGDGMGRVRETILWTLRATSAAGFEHLSPRIGTAAWMLPRAPLVAKLTMWTVMGLTAAAILHAGARSAASLRSLARGSRGEPRDRALVLCTLIVVLVVGAYVLGGAAPVPHYAVLMHPFLALLLVWSLGRASLRGLDRPLFAALALVNAFFVWRFESGLTQVPNEVGGRYGLPYAARRDEWQPRLAAGFDEVLHGEARRRERNESLEREFSASTRRLLHLDPSMLETQGSIDVEPTPDGLRVRGGGTRNLLWFPPMEIPEGTEPLLRIDLTCPVGNDLVFLHGTKGNPEISRQDVEIVPAPAGRSTQLVRIRTPPFTGRIALRLGTYRATIHDVEIRAVGITAR